MFILLLLSDYITGMIKFLPNFDQILYIFNSSKFIIRIKMAKFGLLSLNSNAIAYAATTLASSMMNSVFFFYYVKLFIDHYNLAEDWFQFAQVNVKHLCFLDSFMNLMHVQSNT